MGVKKIIEEENTELWWNLYDKMFSNRKEIDNFIYKACEPVSKIWKWKCQLIKKWD